MKFAKLLRTPMLKDICERLLLTVESRTMGLRVTLSIVTPAVGIPQVHSARILYLTSLQKSRWPLVSFRKCAVINIYLSSPYPFKFFKDCLPQILLSSFLNTWMHIIILSVSNSLRVKCRNTELFLVRFLLYSDWIQRFTTFLDIFHAMIINTK